MCQIIFPHNINIHSVEFKSFIVTRIIQTEDGYTNKYIFCTYNFDGEIFRHGAFDSCHFQNISMRGAVFSGATFLNCVFDQIDLSNACFDDVMFINCRFTQNNLQKASFKHCKWSVTDNAHRTFFDFAKNNMQSIDFTGADLYHATFSEWCESALLKNNRAQMISATIPLVFVNNLQADALDLITRWDVIVGKSKNTATYPQILNLLTQLSSHKSSLATHYQNFSCMHKLPITIKSEIKDFMKTHIHAIKHLIRESFYKRFLQSFFNILTQKNGIF